MRVDHAWHDDLVREGLEGDASTLHTTKQYFLDLPIPEDERGFDHTGRGDDMGAM
jgi:hypothetical protein